jgi:hypothetical protein
MGAAGQGGLPRVGKLLRHAPRYARCENVAERVHRIPIVPRIELAKPLAAGVIDSKAAGDFNYGPGPGEITRS